MEHVSFFNVLDYVYIGIMLLSSIFGFIGGFTKVFLNTIAWFGSGALSIIIAPMFHGIVGTYLKDEMLIAKVSTFMAYVIVLIISLIISNFVSEKIKQSSLSGLDKSLGLLIGLIRGFFVPIGVCAIFLMFNVPRDTSDLVGESRISTVLFEIADNFTSNKEKSGLSHAEPKKIKETNSKKVNVTNPAGNISKISIKKDKIKHNDKKNLTTRRVIGTSIKHEKKIEKTKH